MEIGAPSNWRSAGCGEEEKREGLQFRLFRFWSNTSGYRVQAKDAVVLSRPVRSNGPEVQVIRAVRWRDCFCPADDDDDDDGSFVDVAAASLMYFPD